MIFIQRLCCLAILGLSVTACDLFETKKPQPPVVCDYPAPPVGCNYEGGDPETGCGKKLVCSTPSPSPNSEAENQ